MTGLQIRKEMFQRRCHTALQKLIEYGANNYERQRHLPRLLPVNLSKVKQDCRWETMQIVRALQYAMRIEKGLGLELIKI